MDLTKFSAFVNQWIAQFDNVKLSGVAIVINGGEHWSASLAVTQEGMFPQVKLENHNRVKEYVKLHELSNSFELYSVSMTKFIMQPDLIGMRWQIQWSFRK